MKKVCRKCKVEKDIDDFYKRPDMVDGRLNHCKKCQSDYQKKYKRNKGIEPSTEPRMAATTKKDYCVAFRWLKVLGYDLDKDIHQQFIDKHGIKKYKPRPAINKRRYEPSDCFRKKQ